MSLEQLVQNYGYLAVLTGTFLEGETILVLGGMAAKLGYLRLPGVIAVAFAGTLAGDQLYFHLGRRHGPALLARRPAWQARAGQVQALLGRHPDMVILGFRFLYGLRTVTPFIIGMSDISGLRFLLLNALGAAGWAVVIGSLGYLFGHGLEIILGDLHRYELEAMAATGVIGGLVWLGSRLHRRHRPR